MKLKSLSRVRFFTTPWTAAHQAPLSMGFSRQEYWSGVPLPSPLVLVRLNQSWSRGRAGPVVLHELWESGGPRGARQLGKDVIGSGFEDDLSDHWDSWVHGGLWVVESALGILTFVTFYVS